MQLHVPTLFAVIIAVSAVLALAIAYLGHRRHADMFLWSIALGLQTVAYALFALRGHVADVASIVLGNLALASSLAIYAQAVLRFRRRRWPVRWVWSPVAVVGVAFPLLMDEFQVRLVLGGLVYGAQCLLVVGTLLHRRREPLGRGEYLLIHGALLVATLMAVRVWAVGSGYLTVEFVTDGGVLQGLTFMASITGTLLLALGIIIMNEESAERSLLENEQYQAFRNQVLEMLAQGAPLQALLQTIVRGIESLHPQMMCSILLLDRQGKHLQEGAAPSLPDFFNAAVHGLAIGPGVGSCGTAAYTGQRVVVTDIEHHPYWQPFLDIARQAGLGACWSQPILSSDQTVLGTFAIYHHQPHTPKPTDIALIEQSAVLAGIAIERSTAASQLLERERQYRLLIETANEGIAVFQDGVLRFGNPRFFEMMGYAAREILERHFDLHIHEDDRTRVLASHRRRMQGEAVEQQQPFRVLTKHRGMRWFEISGTLFEWQGQTSVLAFLSDITERREMQERIQQQALHDSLTELPNRRLLTHNLGLAMAGHKRSGLHGALMFLDLDNFKPLNDTHGHKVGDLLLVEVAHRLRQGVRENDTVARFGGDEFVVLLGDLDTDLATSSTHAHTVAQKLLAALAQPYRLEVAQSTGALKTVEHRCTASIGVVLFNGRETEPDELLKQADMAMYRAKQAGRNTVCFGTDGAAPLQEAVLTPA